MDNVVLPAVQYDSELELESLGLGLFDVDVDLDECFKNCPEWNDPILDTSVLDDLRDCLSEDLWSSPDMQPLTGADTGSHNNEPLQPPTGTSCLATPPQSPDSAPSPSPSVASSTTSTALSSDALSPQKVPSPWNGVVPAQNGTGPEQGHLTGVQQSTLWNSTSLGVQILKSGEVVCMPPVTPEQTQPGTQQAPLAGSSHAQATTQPVQKTTATRKRSHPDSGANTDTKSAAMSQLSKKQQRLIKNREAASMSRQKKKEYVQTLETRLKEAAIKNNTLLQENESLRKQVVKLETENKTLRATLSQPGSPLSSLQRPALVMVLCLCFVSLLFLPKYTDLSLSSPATSTALSRIPGRALLEYREQSTHSSLSMSQDKQHSKEHHALQPPPGPTHKGSSTSALVPVFNAVPSTLDQKMNELRRLREALPCPPPASSVCSCPAQNKSNNHTALRMLSEEMTECFKWYEEHYPKWLHPGHNKTPQNSLAVVVNSNNALPESGDYHMTDLHDMPLHYKSFKKLFTRKLDNFYLISFKDHLLLNAPLHNSTEPPLLSVIIPTQGYSLDTYPMLQIDCEILNTNIIHMPRARV